MVSVLGVLALGGRGSCKSNFMVMTGSGAGKCKLESPTVPAGVKKVTRGTDI